MFPSYYHPILTNKISKEKYSNYIELMNKIALKSYYYHPLFSFMLSTSKYEKNKTKIFNSPSNNNL